MRRPPLGGLRSLHAACAARSRIGRSSGVPYSFSNILRTFSSSLRRSSQRVADTRISTVDFLPLGTVLLLLPWFCLTSCSSASLFVPPRALSCAVQPALLRMLASASFSLAIALGLLRYAAQCRAVSPDLSCTFRSTPALISTSIMLATPSCALGSP